MNVSFALSPRLRGTNVLLELGKLQSEAVLEVVELVAVDCHLSAGLLDALTRRPYEPVRDFDVSDSLCFVPC